MVSEKSILKFLNEPVYALSSATCFHSFLEFQNQEINDEKTITFLQKVFRNEDRFNHKEIGRHRDYHVREVVFYWINGICNRERRFYYIRSC